MSSHHGFTARWMGSHGLLCPSWVHMLCTSGTGDGRRGRAQTGRGRCPGPHDTAEDMGVLCGGERVRLREEAHEARRISPLPVKGQFMEGTLCIPRAVNVAFISKSLRKCWFGLRTEVKLL